MKPTKEVLDYISTHCKYDPITGEIACDRKYKVRKKSSSHLAFTFYDLGTSADKEIYYHHVVWFLAYGEWPLTGMVIDHNDGDPTNNKLGNIRLATYAGNTHNRGKQAGKVTSVYKGVSYRQGLKKPWRSTIMQHDKQIQLGYFATEEEAARAYDARATELFGEFACLNFGANNAVDRKERLK